MHQVAFSTVPALGPGESLLKLTGERRVVSCTANSARASGAVAPINRLANSNQRSSLARTSCRAASVSCGNTHTHGWPVMIGASSE
jgi:hypothetical protein